MKKIIKDHAIIDDPWLWVEEIEAFTKEVLDDKNQHLILPYSVWKEQTTAFSEHPHQGVWLKSDEPPQEHLLNDSNRFEVIAIHFPVFGDGRGYSYARKLRESGYDGEIRAVGDVLQDQLFYMKRCGFNAFDLREDKKLEMALSSLNDFSETYQGCIDQPEPLYKRHSL